MRVTTLSLRHYRNYEAADVKFGPGCTLILGSNGQGKTNLVESLVFLSSQSSHRSSSQQLLIQREQEQAVVRTEVLTGDRTVTLELELNRTKANRAQLNSNAAKLKDFPAQLSVVLFSPEQLSLIQGEPSGRREYIEDLIAHLSPRMAGVFSDFDRVLKQRNTLLKSLAARGLKNIDWSTLEVWDEKFVSLATQIAQARERLVEYLSAPLAKNYELLAAADHSVRVAMEYEVLELATGGATGAVFDASEYERSIRQWLVDNRSRECDRGVTLIGPHRDDFFIGLHGLPAKGCASHGETWSLLIALNLAAAQVVRDQSSCGDPILVLDDVFSALDENRRERLAAEIAAYEQAIVTGAVQTDIPEGLHARIMRVSVGTVES